MGDVPFRKPTEEESAKAEEIARIVIAGHPQAAVRRIILYVVLAVGVIIASIIGPAGLLLPLPALLLLALTDQLA